MNWENGCVSEGGEERPVAACWGEDVGVCGLKFSLGVGEALSVALRFGRPDSADVEVLSLRVTGEGRWTCGSSFSSACGADSRWLRRGFLIESARSAEPCKTCVSLLLLGPRVRHALGLVSARSSPAWDPFLLVSAQRSTPSEKGG